MNITRDKATYLYALGGLSSIGLQGLRRIALAFPEPWQILEASDDELALRLDRKLAYSLRLGLDGSWSDVWRSAVHMSERHSEHGIHQLAISDNLYPPLLKRISDAPVIVYVRGNLDALRQENAVAVVGTRDPTSLGMTIARKIAYHFASQGFVIVSGLAKGIDTAGHLGTLEAKGTTVAVVATALDTVYPSANKNLAERICAEGGAIVSEYAFGQKTFKGAFVQRDRIQAGLSLAVIVVQTQSDGGAMHTARFAERYGRMVLCPQPPESDTTAPEYSGILELLRQNRAQSFTGDDYEDIERRLQQVRHLLLPVDVEADGSHHMDVPQSSDEHRETASPPVNDLWSQLPND